VRFKPCYWPDYRTARTSSVVSKQRWTTLPFVAAVPLRESTSYSSVSIVGGFSPGTRLAYAYSVTPDPCGSPAFRPDHLPRQPRY
jgi:hypothetical protein